ncbi:MAG: hypothetical protein Q9177_004621 [Variospora cf. flavescens]
MFVQCVKFNASFIAAAHRDTLRADFRSTVESVRKVAEDLELYSEPHRRPSTDDQALRNEQQRQMTRQTEEIRKREEACQLVGEKIIKLTLAVTDLEKRQADKQNNLDLVQAKYRDYEIRLTKAQEDLSSTRVEHETLKATMLQVKEQQALDRSSLDERAERLRQQQDDLETTAGQQTEEAERLQSLKLEHDRRESEVSKAEGELTRRKGRNDHAQTEFDEALGSLQSLTRLLGPHTETRSSCTDAKQIATAVKERFVILQDELKLMEDTNQSLHNNINEKTETIESFQTDMRSLQSQRDELKQSASTASSELKLLTSEVRGLRHSYNGISEERTMLAAANEKLQKQNFDHVSHLERERSARQDFNARLDQIVSTLATLQSLAASTRQKDKDEIARLQRSQGKRDDMHVRKEAERSTQAIEDMEEVERLQSALRTQLRLERPQTEPDDMHTREEAKRSNQAIEDEEDVDRLQSVLRVQLHAMQSGMSTLGNVETEERWGQVLQSKTEELERVKAASKQEIEGVQSQFHHLMSVMYDQNRDTMSGPVNLPEDIHQMIVYFEETRSSVTKTYKNLFPTGAPPPSLAPALNMIVSRIQGKLKELSSTRAVLRKKVDQAEANRDASKEEATSLGKQLADTVRERDVMKAELDSKSSMIRIEANRYRELQQQQFTLQEQLATLTSERDDLKQRLQGNGAQKLSARLERSVASRTTPVSTSHRRPFDHLDALNEHDRAEENPERAPKRQRGPNLAGSSVRRAYSISSESGFTTTSHQPGTARGSVGRAPTPAPNRDQEQWVAVDVMRRDNFTYGDIPPAIFDKIRQQINGYQDERGWDEIWPKWAQGTAKGVVKCADRFAHRHRSDMSDGYACEDCFQKISVCVAVKKGMLQIRPLRPQDRGESTKEEMGFWVAGWDTSSA